MKSSPDSSDARWAQLAARARADRPPPLAVASALAAARTEVAGLAARPASRSWLDDFASLFATPRRLVGCGGVAALAVGAAVLVGLEAWQQLSPWADLFWSAMEGTV